MDQMCMIEHLSNSVVGGTVTKEWNVWKAGELEFTSAVEYRNPYLEGELTVMFRSPSGMNRRVKGFWDGGSRWLVRFAPDEEGIWSWWSVSSDMTNDGLYGRSGRFNVQPVSDQSSGPARHGFLRLHQSGRRFVHADGTPFFWLGDTVWSVSANATISEWLEYLKVRAEQGYTIAQINSMPQWDASVCIQRKPFVGVVNGNRQTYDFSQPFPEYFQTLDNMVEAAFEHGILCAIVVLWFNYVEGTNLDWKVDLERHAIGAQLARRYGEYLAARYSAYGAIWLISGDTDAPVSVADPVYDAAARGVLEGASGAPLLTAHLHGGIATPESWNEKGWLGFHMFQSCHFRDSVERAVKYAASDRAFLPARPVLNGEPVYDSIRFLDQGNSVNERAGREFVRHVAWVSILSGAAAGITYGAHGLWPWHRTNEPYRQVNYGLPLSWREALDLPSGEDMGILKRILTDFRWSDLKPETEIVQFIPDSGMVSARSPEGVVVVYFPDAPKEAIKLTIAVESARWFCPETGQSSSAVREIGPPIVEIPAYPNEGDAVLILVMAGTENF